MKIKKIIFSFLILLCCMVTVACTNSNNENTTSKGDKETDKEGGTLRIAGYRYETLNPLLNKSKDVDQILELMFDPIMKIDENLKPYNYLAEEVKVDDVGASIDVKLKEGILFHNGIELTADDVVYSLDVLKKASDDVLYKNVISNIGTYKKLDNYTVRIYLRQVYSNSEYALCFPIISKEYYSNTNNDTTNNVMGTGMFKIKSIEQMQEMILEKNDNYFNTKPYVDEISVLLVPDEKTIQTAFKQKQIDIMFTSDMIAGQYTGNEAVDMLKYSTMYYDFLGFNFKNEVLAKSEIRRIIAHSIEKNEIVKDVYYGYAKVADTMIHPDSFLYTSGTEYEYDLRMAKNLLAGLNLKENQLNFKLLVNEENDERCQIADLISNKLSSIGINITVEKLPFEQYKQKLENKDFDMVIGGWHLLTNQDISFAYSSSNVYSGQNYISYSSKEMDDILKQAYTQVGIVNVKSAFATMQEFLGSELPYISIDFRENVGYINKNNIGGELKPLEHNLYNGIESIYVKNK